MIKLWILVVSLLFIVVLAPRPTDAHVLLRDENKRIGAVLHVNPDDDPIAGQQSNLFFDVKSQELKNNSIAKLKITDSAGKEDRPPVSVNGNSASIDYTFPSQGIYNLELSLQSNNNLYTFKYSQRVARGTSASALDKPSHPLAEITLVASISLFLIICIIVFNRRQEIARQSKF